MILVACISGALGFAIAACARRVVQVAPTPVSSVGGGSPVSQDDSDRLGVGLGVVRRCRPDSVAPAMGGRKGGVYGV